MVFISYSFLHEQIHIYMETTGARKTCLSAERSSSLMKSRWVEAVRLWYCDKICFILGVIDNNPFFISLKVIIAVIYCADLKGSKKCTCLWEKKGYHKPYTSVPLWEVSPQLRIRANTITTPCIESFFEHILTLK